MADNVTTQTTTPATIPGNTVISTEEVTTLNGGAVTAQQVQRVALALRTADGTAIDLPGDSVNGLDSDITRDVTTSFDHGAKSSIGATALQLTASSIVATRGVLVKAANGNTAIVYVGNADVTAGSTDATDGFELGAGESVLVKVNNANLIYVIASDVGQKVFWVTV